jgi:hypothetical protein
MSNYELGRMRDDLSANELVVLAIVLDVKLADLLGTDDEPDVAVRLGPYGDVSLRGLRQRLGQSTDERAVRQAVEAARVARDELDALLKAQQEED